VAVPSAGAAPAPNNCDGTGTVAVQFLALQSAQNVTMLAQPDGSYARTMRARAYCTDSADPPNDIGEVTNAQVAVWIDANPGLDILVNGQSATNRDAPVLINAANGFADITISSTDPDILDVSTGQWKAKVGRNNVVIARAFNSAIPSGDAPEQSGALWAQTPELGSLALFGAGAAGMAGYALTRLRAGFGRRRPRE
jgi:hypothetical protein